VLSIFDVLVASKSLVKSHGDTSILFNISWWIGICM